MLRDSTSSPEGEISCSATPLSESLSSTSAPLVLMEVLLDADPSNALYDIAKSTLRPIHFILDYEKGVVKCTNEKGKNTIGEGRKRKASQESADSGSSSDKAQTNGQNDTSGDVNNSEEGNVASDRKRRRCLSEEEKRLGCPYYKNTWWRCTEHKSCSRPGWADIHRTKYALPLVGLVETLLGRR
jgi:hypothetical protein